MCHPEVDVRAKVPEDKSHDLLLVSWCVVEEGQASSGSEGRRGVWGEGTKARPGSSSSRLPQVRVYSPYQDYYEVVPPNAHEATYVRSYYGPPYAGKSPCTCISQDQATLPALYFQIYPGRTLPTVPSLRCGPRTSLRSAVP